MLLPSPSAVAIWIPLKEFFRLFPHNLVQELALLIVIVVRDNNAARLATPFTLLPEVTSDQIASMKGSLEIDSRRRHLEAEQISPIAFGMTEPSTGRHVDSKTFSRASVDRTKEPGTRIRFCALVECVYGQMRPLRRY